MMNSLITWQIVRQEQELRLRKAERNALARAPRGESPRSGVPNERTRAGVYSQAPRERAEQPQAGGATSEGCSVA
jgi:hypothetical protein